MYAVDAGNNRVEAFSAANTFTGSWGSTGSGDGQFQAPRAIAATSQGVYVADRTTNRVEKFTSTGAFVDTLDSSVDPALQLPIGLAISSAGLIYTSQQNGRIARYGETGAGGGGGGTLPPPQTGESANAVPVDGTVKVREPGSSRFELLNAGEQIKIGSIVDVRKGTVELTTASGGNSTQTANFFEGVFQLLQDKKKNPVTEVRLYGGNFKKACPKPRKASASAKKKSVRHLWGSGKGKFRTRGRYASAVIRGTEWRTDDRCDGTNVKVKEGSVTVRDLVKNKNVTVKAPKSYLAKAKALRKPR